jgi:hypothetical protein
MCPLWPDNVDLGWTNNVARYTRAEQEAARAEREAARADELEREIQRLKGEL